MEHELLITLTPVKLRYLNLTVGLVHELISGRNMKLSEAIEACCSLRTFFAEQFNEENVPYGGELFDACYARSFQEQIQLIYD